MNVNQMRAGFEEWMIKEAKFAIGSADPYAAGIELDDTEQVGSDLTSTLPSPWPFCAHDGTCSCAKFHDDPDGCEERMERGIKPAQNNATSLPVSIKDHVVRDVVNELRDIAIKFHGAGQLRARLRAAIEPLLANKTQSKKEEK